MQATKFVSPQVQNCAQFEMILFKTGITPNCVTEEERVPRLVLLPTSTTVWQSHHLMIVSLLIIFTSIFTTTTSAVTPLTLDVPSEADAVADPTVAV